MVDASLMRGDGWVRCCICGTLHERPYPDLFRDASGHLWDTCREPCASQSGLTEMMERTTHHRNDAT